MKQAIRKIPVVLLNVFQNHPFKVIMDASMTERTESVKQYGVMVLTIVRSKNKGRYGMVAGPRRMRS